MPFFILICLMTPLMSWDQLRGAGSSLPDCLRISVMSKYAPKEITIRTETGFLQAVSSAEVRGMVHLKYREEGILCSYGKSVFTVPRNRPVIFSSQKKFTVSAGSDERIFSGRLIITAGNCCLRLTLIINTEEYIAASASAELGELAADSQYSPSLPGRKELVKAMEVAIRSYIAAQKDRHESQDYEFCDLTHCLHFPGLGRRENRSLTPGILMLDRSGRPVNAWFHSSCGGILAGPEVMWPGAAGENFRRGPDAEEDGSGQGKILCSASPHSRWEYFLSMDTAEVILNQRPAALETEVMQGRVSALVWKTGSGRSGRISAAAFLSKTGRILGWNRIKSSLFTVTKQGNGWLIKGKGLGHGTGMCQWGAAEMARQGKDFISILKFYYNNPVISN